MTETDKKIIELKQKGYTYSQISNLLGISINYVKRRGTKRFLESQKRLEAKEIANEEFEKMVIDFLPYSNSINNLCSNIGVRCVRHYSDKIKEIIKKNNLSTSHFGTLEKKTQPKGVNKYTAMTNEEFFVNGVNRNSKSILKRLIEGGYREYKCENLECGISNWHNKDLKLQIHHINGKHNDNRLENIQILCPNCHSQTDNYARQNKTNSYKITERAKEIFDGKPKFYTHKDITDIKDLWVTKEKNFCLVCKKEIPKNQIFCSQQCSHEHSKKFDVDNDTLIEDFKTLKSYRKVGKKYGVSDNAIKKRCVKNGIIDIIKQYVTSRNHST